MSPAEREQLLTKTAEAELRYAAELRRGARETYNDALGLAAAAGMTNKKMGEIVGVSETAIRNYRKRNQL